MHGSNTMFRNCFTNIHICRQYMWNTIRWNIKFFQNSICLIHSLRPIYTFSFISKALRCLPAIAPSRGSKMNTNTMLIYIVIEYFHSQAHKLPIDENVQWWWVALLRQYYSCGMVLGSLHSTVGSPLRCSEEQHSQKAPAWTLTSPRDITETRIHSRSEMSPSLVYHSNVRSASPIHRHESVVYIPHFHAGGKFINRITTGFQKIITHLIYPE